MKAKKENIIALFLLTTITTFVLISLVFSPTKTVFSKNLLAKHDEGGAEGAKSMEEIEREKKEQERKEAEEFWELDYPWNPPKPNLPDYVSYIYQLSFWIGTSLAIVMIIYGGVKWSSSTSNPQIKADAKNKITRSLIGLIALFAIFVVLRAINPDILILRDLDVEEVKTPNVFEEDGVEFQDTNWCNLNSVGIFCGEEGKSAKCCKDINCQTGSEGDSVEIGSEASRINCSWGTAYYWSGSGKVTTCDGDNPVQLYCNEEKKCAARNNPEWPDGCSAIGKTCQGGVCY